MFKIDFINGTPIAWSKESENSVKAEKISDYRPRFYIDGANTKLLRSRPWISSRNHVEATKFEKWKPTLSKEKTKVLRIDVSSEQKLMDVVTDLKKNFPRSTFKFYNVGFSQQFRFCLQKQVKPVPEHDLTHLSLDLHRKHLADEDITGLKINGEKAGETEEQVLETLKTSLNQENPDLLMVNRGQVLRLLNQKISVSEKQFSLGRMKKFQTVAGENTVSSYGKTVHSNARFNIPGRIIIDKSNSFLLKDATIEGLWDLVKRSYRPMQELAWGSIGRLLTSIEVKKAYIEENTLTPWKNWEAEEPKKASTMHKADRGGFIFNPDPGVHEDVYEVDFASLFPNIMVKKNISPETVCCSCCNNRKVPELDYSICEKQRGFISQVLKPLVEDRQEMKEKIKTEDLPEEERKYFQGSVDAIKWLLVSCFGYMGHSHASYGSIECHQAIQAFDREIMIKAKEIFENNGYKIVHGIIDSIWVKEKGEAEPIEKVCEKVTEEIGIKLEFEHFFEWVAFVPRSSSEADISTLNRYFGKKGGEENGFKTAGIEVEQDSKPVIVKECQKEMIEAFDQDRDPEDVFKVLETYVERLESFEVEPEKLVITKSVSKSLDEYQVSNRSVSALKRYKKHGIDIKPGQNISFIVRDDDMNGLERVRLDFETVGEYGYDSGFYKKLLIRACESVLSPSGFDEKQIKTRISGEKKQALTYFQ